MLDKESDRGQAWSHRRNRPGPRCGMDANN